MKITLFAIFLLCAPVGSFSQSATVTNNVLFRTFLVRTDKGSGGTIFSVDVDNREYWITAKHVLTGKTTSPFGEYTEKTVSLSVLAQVEVSQTDVEKNWIRKTFTVLDPGKDVDIVVLASEKLFMPDAVASAATSDAKVTFGGDCEFVGFPYGQAWAAKFESKQVVRFPFIKHCTISGRLTSPQEVWVLDGINNEGFSGGPVVVETGTAQKIIGVISGYHPEKSDVMLVEVNSGAVEASRPAEYVNLNSGIILAYDMRYVLDAVKKNPIGPLRPKK
jgi:hypothetical protein